MYNGDCYVFILQTDVEYGDKIVFLRKNGFTCPYIAEGSVSQEKVILMLTGLQRNAVKSVAKNIPYPL